MGRIAAVAVATFSVACASVTASGPDTDPLCSKLSQFALGNVPGETRSIKLAVGGEWMINDYKYCDPVPRDQAGEHLCSWLMDNTSTEFMDSNVERVMQCLQGHRLHEGETWTSRIDRWEGKARFPGPAIDIPDDSAIEVEFSLRWQDSQEDYIQIAIVPHE